MKKYKLIKIFALLSALLVVSLGLNIFQYSKIKNLSLKDKLLIAKKDAEIKNLKENVQPKREKEIIALKEMLKEKETPKISVAKDIEQYDTFKNIMTYEKLKTITFQDNNKMADRIYFKYLASSFNSTVEEFQELCKEFPCRIYTAEVDLNDDGVNEIIGGGNDCSARHCNAVILRKEEDRWVKVSDFPYVDGRFDILKEKNLGYHSIRPHGYINGADEKGRRNNFATYIVKYTKDNSYNLYVFPKKEKTN